MNLLWFTMVPSPSMLQRLGIDQQGTGNWLYTTAETLSQEKNIQLSVACGINDFYQKMKFKEGNITYICFPRAYSLKNKVKTDSFSKILKIAGKYIASNDPDQIGIINAKVIVEDCQPDLIHIHGTEDFYGLIAREVHQSVLITMQGILKSIYDNFWGNLTHRDQIFFPILRKNYQTLSKNVLREQRIFSSNKYFSGRTNWDHCWQRSLQPEGMYFNDQGRIMRSGFYNRSWSIKIKNNHVIYTTMTNKPYKGLDVLLDALKIIEEQYPNVSLRVGCDLRGEFGDYIQNKINELDLKNRVTILGYLSDLQIAKELVNAHVFVLPSFIENESCSLIEAQLVGTPCVATFTGGIPSTLANGEAGLFFPKGDAQYLAICIGEIFKDDALAQKLSHNSRKIARARNSPHEVVSKLIEIYSTIIDNK
jgi:glycosyltransferase involved in cell wall biosynthesis